MMSFYASNTLKVAIVAGFLILIGSMLPLKNELQAYHSPEELDFYKQHAMLLTIDSNQYFPSSRQCVGCHGFDLEGYAMVDSEGNDVNIEDDWRTSMMANSAKDPFWKAKVSHETRVNPGHAADTENTCTSCHAPMGHYTAKFQGQTHYGMADLAQDTLGLDGVSCGACHQISEDLIGQLHSGQINFDTNRVQYGPYPQPFGAPMSDFVGFSPVYSEHINDAGLCASCHTLINESLDLEGNKTGNFFVEQATYHEWLNSRYNTDDVSCQSCHLPRINDTVVIADNLLFLQGRSPYGLHELAGANTFMLQLMKENKALLGIDAEDVHFDSTIAATYRMLQQKSLEVDLALDQLNSDTAYFRLDVLNKAGHKFPSGYPSRRAYIEFVVVSTEGDTLFHSGKRLANGRLESHDPHFEPHYDIINREDQVQIYELVNGDINGQFTSVLERGYQPLKDNRLPPQGFTTSHRVYDTTLIAGAALLDMNFNRQSGAEGSGTDELQYHIPMNNFTGLVDVYARVYYEALPKRWLDEMFEESSIEINFFEALYNGTEQEPVLVQQAVIEDLYLESTSVRGPLAERPLKVFPNPVSSGLVHWNYEGTEELVRVRIYSADGRLLLEAERPEGPIRLPEAKGIYLMQFEFEGFQYNKRILRK
ncbi:MAG: T9SS type A sorting domain-containing protein [Bacteroidota bacterium]